MWIVSARKALNKNWGLGMCYLNCLAALAPIAALNFVVFYFVGFDSIFGKGGFKITAVPQFVGK